MSRLLELLMIRNVVSLVFFSLALSVEAFAEDATSPADDVVEPAPAPRYPHPLTRRNTGVVLTATGAAWLGSGAALLLGSTTQTGTSQAAMVFFGGVLSGISVPFLAPGIPLWVSGNKRMKQDTPRFDARLHVVPGPRPTVAIGGTF